MWSTVTRKAKKDPETGDVCLMLDEAAIGAQLPRKCYNKKSHEAAQE